MVQILATFASKTFKRITFMTSEINWSLLQPANEPQIIIFPGKIKKQDTNTETNAVLTPRRASEKKTLRKCLHLYLLHTHTTLPYKILGIKYVIIYKEYKKHSLAY